MISRYAKRLCEAVSREDAPSPFRSCFFQANSSSDAGEARRAATHCVGESLSASENDFAECRGFLVTCTTALRHYFPGARGEDARELMPPRDVHVFKRRRVADISLKDPTRAPAISSRETTASPFPSARQFFRRENSFRNAARASIILRFAGAQRNLNGTYFREILINRGSRGAVTETLVVDKVDLQMAAKGSRDCSCGREDERSKRNKGNIFLPSGQRRLVFANRDLFHLALSSPRFYGTDDRLRACSASRNRCGLDRRRVDVDSTVCLEKSNCSRGQLSGLFFFALLLVRDNGEPRARRNVLAVSIQRNS